MNPDGHYRKFHDDSTEPNPKEPVTSPPPSYSPPPIQMDKQMTTNFHRTKRLATVELVISCLILLFGMVSTGLGANIPRYAARITTMGTCIWAPTIGIITAGLGLGALKSGNYSRKCLLVSHFVMCIISAIASGILIIFCCIFLIEAQWLMNYANDWYCIRYRQYCIKHGMPEALIAFQAAILIGALIHMIASIVSTAFICRYWCGRKSNAGTTVLYIPNPSGPANCPMQTIAVPPGAQVIFIPSNGQVPSNPTVAP